jgi:hypothetical protein
MAFRLGEYVLYGELRNTGGYHTFGIVVLRGEREGEERVLQIQLTGDCAADMKGEAVRFMPRDQSAVQVFPANDMPRLHDQQIGPTGDMTTESWCRVIPCSATEFYQRAKLGEPPPTEWKRRVYLEWYSQNGRVVIEMADPIVERCVRAPEGFEDEGDWEPMRHLTPRPDTPAASPDRSEDEQCVFDDVPDGEQMESESDPLQAALDREAAEIDRAIGLDPVDEETELAIHEMEIMDECLDGDDDGEPLATFDLRPEKLPHPDDLDDEAVEIELKKVLARMAMLGLALDVCEHYTPRDCYRLLVEQLLHDTRIHERLVGSGWVQHMCTYEYCKRCDDELEERAANGEFDVELPE